jgi:hypothetical protein
MTPKTALKKLGLTGTGTHDRLVLDLGDGVQVTLNREDIPAWPQGKELRKSTVVLGGVVFSVSYAVDVMNAGVEYFALVAT